MTDLFSLSGQRVCVTGGAGLLGATFCQAIAAAGGTAYVADISTQKAEDTAQRLNKEGHSGSVFPLMLDITQENSLVAAFKWVQKNHGPLTALVNNAYPRNAQYGRCLEDVTYADFTENMGLHAGGYFLTSRVFAQHTIATGTVGTIINMSSIYGVMAPRFDVYADTPMTMPVEYAAIKSAILHLTRYFAQYYKKAGLRVNAISPGGIEDGQPQSFQDAYKSHCGLTGMLDKEDITGALVFLLSKASRHVTGQNLIVDDGFVL